METKKMLELLQELENRDSLETGTAGKGGVIKVYVNFAEQEKAKDPVCGMSVVKNEDLKSLFEGNSFYFCSNNCKEGFDKNPVNFVENE